MQLLFSVANLSSFSAPHMQESGHAIAEATRQLRVHFAGMVSRVAKTLNDRDVDPLALKIYIKEFLKDDKETVASISLLVADLSKTSTVIEIFDRLASANLWNYMSYQFFADIVTEFDDKDEECIAMLEQYHRRYTNYAGENGLEQLVTLNRQELDLQLGVPQDFSVIEITLDSPWYIRTLDAIKETLNVLFIGVRNVLFGGGRKNCITLTFHVLPSESGIIRKLLDDADTTDFLIDEYVIMVSLDGVTIFSGNEFKTSIYETVSCSNVQFQTLGILRALQR